MNLKIYLYKNMLVILCYLFLTIYCNVKKLNKTKIFSLDKELNYLNLTNITNSNKQNFIIKEKRKRKLEAFENIRIEIHMECLDIILSRANASFGNLIKESITNAKETIEKIIKVKRLTNKINLKDLGFSNLNFICSPFQINSYIDADLAIFIDYYIDINAVRPNSSFDDKDFLAKPDIIYFSDDSRPIIGSIIVNLGIAS